MAGEYFHAQTIEQYWKQLKAFHQARSPQFREINEQEYNSIERSEREDSDNHVNQDRLGSETEVTDATFYKYLPNQEIAYRSHIVNTKGEQEIHYYIASAYPA